MASNRYSIVLRNVGNQKLLVVKTIRELTGKSLKQCAEIVEHIPSVVASGLPRQRATAIKESFDYLNSGAQIDIVPDDEARSLPSQAAPSAGEQNSQCNEQKSHYDKGKGGCMLALLIPLAFASFMVAAIVII